MQQMYMNVYGAFLSHGGSPSHYHFQYEVMVIHDDWMIWGIPHDPMTSETYIFDYICKC